MAYLNKGSDPVKLLHLCFHDIAVQRMKLEGVRRYAEARGWEVVTFSKEGLGAVPVAAQLARHKPVGCIVDCCGNEIPIKPHLFGRFPVVWLDVPSESLEDIAGYPCVCVDEEAVARTALRELSSNFPKSLAAVEFQFEPYQKRMAWSRDRALSFQSLAAADGFTCEVFETREEESPKARAARLTDFLSRLARPCGVFAVNDGTAWQVREACRAARLSVPHEVAIVGADNDPELCDTDTPSLTSIQMDFERAGYVAARMVGDSLATKNTKKHKGFADSASFAAESKRVLQPLLVVRRRSTGGRGRRDPRIMEAVEVIRREAADGLTAAGLAARFNGSRRNFERRFREAVGRSVFDEILDVRIEKAKALLSRNDIAIGAIYFQCGFGSESDLRTHFRRITGSSLSQWRKWHSD